jgi:Cu2+-exporting ATPase
VSQALRVALAAAAPAGDAPLTGSTAAADTVREEPGRGLVWELDGSVWYLGRPGAIANGPAQGSSSDCDGDLRTVFARDGVTLARCDFREEFRPDASRELAGLRDAGYALHLLSGDGEARVRATARALGIPADNVRAALSPEEKAARVRELDDADTLMVGDGLNDGPSFSAAHCAATPAVDRPVLPARADFYFLGDGIAALRHALAAARRLRRVIRDNLVLAVVYNAVAVALSLAGLVTPVVAAVLMPLSSLGVVGLTLARLGRRDSWT